MEITQIKQKIKKKSLMKNKKNPMVDQNYEIQSWQLSHNYDLFFYHHDCFFQLRFLSLYLIITIYLKIQLLHLIS